MTQPVALRLDFAHDVGYIRYREPREGERFSGRRVGDRVDVVVDRDAYGEIVGIELLGLDELTLDVAETFAREHGLRFPRTRLRALESA